MSRIRFFNTTGPCNPVDHYMLPPAERLIGAQLHRYIRDQLYWVLHAPRQTGKTTFLQSWMNEINATGSHTALYISIEDCQGVTDVNEALLLIQRNVRNASMQMGFPDPTPQDNILETLLADTLRFLSQIVAPKPLVILFDEVDVLEGKPLIRFLRLLRNGFASRGAGIFPVSIALVGMRDLKDYITASKDGVAPNPGSPFNIKADSAVLGNFSKDDIVRLFKQRTDETGQQITTEALEYVYEQSKGQPWIVNNLFMRATMRILDEDSRETVSIEHVLEARQQMVMARETHLDALAYRLENPEVRRLMETLMSGEPDISLADSEGFRLCLDLGLVTIERGTPQVANPIYREVLARQMTFSPQLAIPEPAWQWLLPDGNLDMNKLMQEFQKFWRRNADV
ncbi:MAG: AAA-like domain-containing protein, partial [Prevotellaceae bacterium]|nr:AAA-like domain-containing protein [Prevotellaceae bacterium]